MTQGLVRSEGQGLVLSGAQVIDESGYKGQNKKPNQVGLGI